MRLVFCLFSDATGIFEPRGLFLDLMQQRTRPDGSDTGQWLSHLFEILNQPIPARQKSLDEDLTKFPYINGDLFGERLPIPAFDSKMRKLLIEACEFSWSAISPAIFGALFQSVMNSKERRASGAHYTTERNILKVIEPLFLDDLRAEFQHLKARRDTGRANALRAFQDRLGSLTFLDPACGCGNFLIISYREVRALELEILRELNPKGQRVIDVAALSKLNVNQFYGIELTEFPARIAEIALWMMDHIMNNRLSLEFGENYARIPLKTSPHIYCDDALEVDWTTILKPEKCSFVLGNPPFRGAKFQTNIQRTQVRRIAALGGSGGTLDLVAAWFIKAAAYLQTSKAAIGFVATNSITQGEQVAQLWPLLFNRFELELAYAHRTFAWGSDARGVAHVHVVIVGLTRRDQERASKRLFSYNDIGGDPVESKHSVLSPYLIDATALKNRYLVVNERTSSLCHVLKMVTGTQPIDGGHLIFDADERSMFLRQEPSAMLFLKPFLGTEEFVNGIGRWILGVQDATPAQLRAMPHVAERLRAVRTFRRKSKRKSTLAIADYPSKFNVEMIPRQSFLVIPEVSSENREYIPIGWLNPPIIPSNKLRVVQGATLWEFGILTSRMHMAWTHIVGGRLESRFQYSVGINYNAFPWPEVTDRQKARIEVLAQNVLDTRAQFAGASFADLYDPDVMRPELRRAHRALDLAVDKLYRAAAFGGDRERVEHLFGLYELLTAPLTVAAAAKPKRRRAAASK